MKTKKESRRRFLGIAVGTGILVMLGVSKRRVKEQSEHYIGPDGKLYIVDKSRVKKVSSCAPGSKKSLRSWIDRNLKFS